MKRFLPLVGLLLFCLSSQAFASCEGLRKNLHDELASLTGGAAPAEGSKNYEGLMYWCTLMIVGKCSNQPKMCQDWYKAAPRVCAAYQKRYDEGKDRDTIEGFDTCLVVPANQKHKWW